MSYFYSMYYGTPVDYYKMRYPVRSLDETGTLELRDNMAFLHKGTPFKCYKSSDVKESDLKDFYKDNPLAQVVGHYVKYE